MTSLHLEILTKQDCSLCDIAKETVESVLQDYPDAHLAITDIATDPQLSERYQEKIPVIRLNGEDRFVYKVHPQTLRNNLDLLQENCG